GLLATLLRTEHQGRYHFDQTNALVRLADQWRIDVAAARSATLVVPVAAVDPQDPAESQAVPRTTALRLEGREDTKIEFFRDGDRLRRVEYQGSAVKRREAYALSNL